MAAVMERKQTGTSNDENGRPLAERPQSCCSTLYAGRGGFACSSSPRDPLTTPASLVLKPSLDWVNDKVLSDQKNIIALRVLDPISNHLHAVYLILLLLSRCFCHISVYLWAFKTRPCNLDTDRRANKGGEWSHSVYLVLVGDGWASHIQGKSAQRSRRGESVSGF